MRTPQYRYSEYVRLQDPDQETQQPDWDSPVGWGELYDLFVDPDDDRRTLQVPVQQPLPGHHQRVRHALLAGQAQQHGQLVQGNRRPELESGQDVHQVDVAPVRDFVEKNSVKKLRYK